MGSIASNIESINTTKSQLKDKLNYLFDFGLTSSSTFRSYATELLKMYNESPTTSEEVSDNTVAEGYTVLGYKTSYLKNTKELIKEGLTLLGTNPSNTFSTYPDLMDDVYNIFPKRTGESSSITLSPVRKGLIRSSIEGNTEQQTYSGKNKLSPPENYTLQINGITVKSTTNNVYTVSGTSTASANTRAGFLSVYHTIASGEYLYLFNDKVPTGIVQIVGVSSSGSQIFAKTIRNANFVVDLTEWAGSEIKYFSFYNTNGTAYSGTMTLTPMIANGDSAGNYEKYTGGTASPNPDYPQEVKVVSGNNLLNESVMTARTSCTVSNKTITSNSINSWNTFFVNINSIRLEKNTDYYATFKAKLDSGTGTLNYGGNLYNGSTYGTQSRVSSSGALSSEYQEFCWKITTTEDNFVGVAMVFQAGSNSTNAVISIKDIMFSKAPNEAYFPYNTIGIIKQNKNLFNKNTVQTGFINADGTITSNNDYRTSYFIQVKPNTAYYKTQTLSPRTKFFDRNKQPLNTTTYQDISIGGNAGTFTTPNNAYYLKLTINITTTSVSVDNVMIEEGSTASTYEEHKETIYPLTLEGVNLVNKSTVVNGYLNGNGEVVYNTTFRVSDYIDVSETNYITISGNYGGSEINCFYDASKTYLSNFNMSTNKTKTQEVPSNAKYVRCTINASVLDTYRLEKGTTIFPNFLGKIGNYKDRIYRTSGKNLFDYSTNITDNANINNNNMTLVSDNSCKLSYCLCEPNTTYTISRRSPMASRFYVATTQDIPTISGSILSYQGVADNTTTSIAITTPSNAHYIVIRFIYNEVSNYETYAKTIQVEKGSSATSYEPYGTGEWYLHNEIGKVVLNGTESWSKYSGTKRFYITLSDAQTPSTNNNKADIVSNYFTTYSANASADTTINAICLNTDKILAIRYVAYNDETLANFKTWLSTHNTEVYYVLATPQEIKIEGTLKGQLESLWDMYAYEPITYLDGIGDLGPIINASALAKR